MKKINHNQAIKLIRKGYFPKCCVSRIMKPIRSLAELEQLERLSFVQPYTLYGFSNSEISAFETVSDNVISLSLDEAIKMLYSGKKIHAKVLGEKNTFLFLSANALLEFYKKNFISGNSVSFYLEG